jgi:hypothetical protein
LVFISFVDDGVIAGDIKIRVWWRAIISRAQIEGIEDIQSNYALFLGVKHGFKNNIWLQISEILSDIQMLNIQLSHFEVQLPILLWINQLVKVDFDLLALQVSPFFQLFNESVD